MEIILPDTTLSQNGREMATNYLKASFEVGSQPIAGEYKKPEELELIQKVNIGVANLFSYLGISELFREIDAGQVHYLDGDSYRSNLPDARSGGVAMNINKAIVINRDDGDVVEHGAKLFRLLHEAVHLSACNTYKFDEEKLRISSRQSGFSFDTKSPIAGLTFEGFNEAIVDGAADEIQLNNFSLFFGEDAKIEETWDMFSGSYPQERLILDEIVLGIAGKKDVSARDVWLMFCKSQFIGDVMPFRLIEEVFGAGSLKLLATLGHERSNPELSKEEQEAFRINILNYFKSKK
jgi:hypothetical protein